MKKSFVTPVALPVTILAVRASNAPAAPAVHIDFRKHSVGLANFAFAASASTEPCHRTSSSRAPFGHSSSWHARHSRCRPGSSDRRDPQGTVTAW